MLRFELRRAWRWSCAVSFLSACGGTTSGNTTQAACVDDPSRAVDASTIVSAGAIRLGVHSATALASSDAPFDAVLFSEAADACSESLAGAGTERRFFAISIPAGQVRQFPIGATLSAQTAIARLEHDCASGAQPPSTSVFANGGTVTITTNESGGRLAGQYDVSFPSGERLVGSFDTCFCARDKPCATPIP